MIMMCQGIFIDCNKCPTVVGDIDSVETVCLSGQGIYLNSLLPIQFDCESKTAFFFFFKRKLCHTKNIFFGIF